MTLFFRHEWIKQCAHFLSRFKARPRKRRRQAWRLTFEQLEDRTTPAALSWTGNADTLNWGDASNWSGNAVPGSCR